MIIRKIYLFLLQSESAMSSKKKSFILIGSLMFLVFGYRLTTGESLYGSCVNLADMAGGRPYHQPLFYVDWAIIFLLFQATFVLTRQTSATFFKSGVGNNLEFQASPVSTPLTEVLTQSMRGGVSKTEQDYFTRTILAGEGPSFKSEASYSSSLKQIVNENKPDMDDQDHQELCANWLTLDIGQLADWEEQITDRVSPLTQSASDLLEEQSSAVYGEETISNDPVVDYSVMKVIHLKN